MKKTVVVAGINSEIGKSLTKILLDNDYKVIGLYQKESEIMGIKDTDISLMEVDYFNLDTLKRAVGSIKDSLAGFVFMEIYFYLEDVLDFDYRQFEKSYQCNVFAMNYLVRELVKKMNCDSSIVIVNSIEAYRGSFGASAYASAQAAKANLVQTFANIFTELYGVRINSLMAGWIGGVMETDDSFNKAKQSIPMKRLGIPDEVADDIYLLLTRHKYMTGSSLVSDGGYLAVDEQSKTEDLDSGKFYKALDKFFNEAKPGETIWAVSTMMANEWCEDPAEMKFMQNNIDAVERGVYLERMFIFDKKDATSFKDNQFIKLFESNKKVKNTFVDRTIIEKENPQLLSILGDGWIGIDDYVLLVDLPSDGTSRGYATLNTREIVKAKNCFDELKKYAIPLKDLLREE